MPLFLQDNHELVEEDTNDYLRDTISLMTAMEARLSSAEEATASTVNRKEVSTPRRRPKTASSDLRSGKNSAAAKAKEAKEQAKEQWQRRKNYDPLKSMASARKAARDAQSYNTDESSDVESLTSVTRGVSNPRVAMIRSDGGRHSLRQGRTDVPERGGGSPQPQSLQHSPLRRPPFKNVMSQNGGRSTSSLSSKEAEFQVRFANIFVVCRKNGHVVTF